MIVDTYNENIGQAEKWLSEIQLAERWSEKWQTRSLKIVKRYKDERDSDNNYFGENRYNIFWSNIQTLQPAIYQEPPKPQIERRWKDADPLGRIASQILERATTFAISSYDFDSLLKAVRDDYLLVGRGQAWLRYKPTYDTITRYPLIQSDQGGFITPEGQPAPMVEIQQDADGFFYDGEPYQTLSYEEVLCEYVAWNDFLHSPARKWDEVRWVGRKVYLSREELVERFGKEIGERVTLNHLPENIANDKSLGENRGELYKKACIYEIWDKPTKKVYWVSKGNGNQILDTKDDFLGLHNFFPCPKPLYATLTNDSLIPVADYIFYQDQAEQLDVVCARIVSLTNALKVSGLYDASCDEVKRLLSEGSENQLIPVANWPLLAQKGGFDGVVTFMPLGEIVNTLSKLYEVKGALENDIYQITGISDIIRGYSAPSETATAQQLKGQFASLRLNERQKALSRFARDLVSMKAEIIAEHFSESTLMVMAGVANLTMDVQQQFQQAIALLKNDLLRTFRIDIDTNAMVAIDENTDKQSRIEFLQAVGQFMERSLPLAQQMPAFANVIGEMLMFNVRGFHAGRNLESSLEEAIAASQQQAKAAMEAQQQPQTPEQLPPDPAMIKIQQDGQLQQMKLQQDAQLKQAELGLEQSKIQIDQMLAQIKEREQALKEREQTFKEQLAQAELQLKTQEQMIKAQGQQADIDLRSRGQVLSEESTKAELLLKKEDLEQKTLATIQGSSSVEREPREEGHSARSAVITRDAQGNKIVIIEEKRPRKVVKFSTLPDGQRKADMTTVMD